MANVTICAGCVPMDLMTVGEVYLSPLGTALRTNDALGPWLQAANEQKYIYGVLSGMQRWLQRLTLL